MDFCTSTILICRPYIFKRLLYFYLLITIIKIPDVAFVGVKVIQIYSVSFCDISLILRSMAALFMELFELILFNCILLNYVTAVRA